MLGMKLELQFQHHLAQRQSILPTPAQTTLSIHWQLFLDLGQSKMLNSRPFAARMVQATRARMFHSSTSNMKGYVVRNARATIEAIASLLSLTTGFSRTDSFIEKTECLITNDYFNVTTGKDSGGRSVQPLVVHAAGDHRVY